MIINNLTKGYFGELVLYVDNKPVGSVDRHFLLSLYPELEDSTLDEVTFHNMMERSTGRWKEHLLAWRKKGLLN